MKAIYSINGVEPAVQPLRDSYQVTQSDLVSDGSGRSAETGRVIRYMIRRNTYKLTLKFKGTPAEIGQVNGLISGVSVEVEFLDGSQLVTTTFYPSDRNITTNGYTSELSVNLIEI